MEYQIICEINYDQKMLPDEGLSRRVAPCTQMGAFVHVENLSVVGRSAETSPADLLPDIHEGLQKSQTV